MALVLGGAAIEVVRPLQQAGIPAVVVPPPDDAVRYSRQIPTLFTWNWSAPPDTHDEALADRLVAWAQEQPVRPVLFYCWDTALIFVSRHRERLARGFRFVIPDVELVDAIVDKGKFGALADRLSLSVPATVVIPAGCDVVPAAISELGYPLIIKPERKDRLWRRVARTNAKALVVESDEELHTLWPKLTTFGRTLVAQQYVDGPESAIESYHVYADEAGEIAAEFTGKKIRTYPVACGFTTALAITDQADVLHAGRKLVELLDLRGVAKFDFKRASNGQLYLLEVNARASLWVHPGARAGVNIPATVYADLTGGTRPALPEHPRAVTWVHPKDLLAARELGEPLNRWLRFAVRCQAKALWSWRDPMPLAITGTSRLRRKIVG